MSETNPYSAVVAAIPLKEEMITEIGKGVNNAWTVVLSIGMNKSVQMGQKFVIFTLGPEIKDPVTGQSLGHFEVVRGTGSVVHLQNTMCTVRSKETRSSPRYKSVNALAAAIGSQAEVEYFDEPAPFPSIFVGDLARRV